ncbi:P-loop containing nucleoside triphosphate hydrolase protein [Syncephalastrum racemosum]|uniref:Kinesin-like protein n=1 Tax=Syncephalastrum racemosum TaxID=13706 RepID=A0A1X2HGJ9_SYNRA|nr:P-loop containing nucleoside triphosphate hydrolase protein [Syncephalastrum racemosum]
MTNAFLSPPQPTQSRRGSTYRNRSPSTSSNTSLHSRWQPAPTSTKSSPRSPRPTTTITTLTPSLSTLPPRRKSSTSSVVSTASSSSTATTSTVNTSMTSPLSPAENVKVVVRCRPLTQKEFLNKSESCWTISREASRISLSPHGIQKRRETNKGRMIEHHFDNVFQGSDNTDLYQTSIHNLVNQAMEGYNATVFAYGQTASGKTYGNESEPGVIPRAVDDVFSYIRQTQTKEFVLRVSYLEIYNETIRDLLAPENDTLKIHEDKRRGIYVSPLTEEVVTSPVDVLSVIQKGEANRHISTTNYNLHSSRSHTIFQLVIESRERTSTSTALGPLSSHRASKYSSRVECMRISQLSLIDLAGSEKAASDQERRKEGAYINKSLLTLGTVISKLTESRRAPPSHIPFRDSKLTRILQPSLSGQAKVVVICTISPTANSLEESNNTLKFAARVKRIVVKAKNDEVPNDKALLQKYRGEIMELRSKLDTANNVLLQEKEHTQSMLSAERQQHEQQMRQMRLVRTALKERIDHLMRLILNSSTVPMPISPTYPNGNNGPDPSKALERGDSGPVENHGDPWQLVRELQRQLAQVNASKASTEKLLAESRRRNQELEKIVEDNKGLADKVANLEAELSITKAELQVTSILAQEGNTSD